MKASRFENEPLGYYDTGSPGINLNKDTRVSISTLRRYFYIFYVWA
jgi:hypothetical protein